MSVILKWCVNEECMSYGAPFSFEPHRPARVLDACSSCGQTMEETTEAQVEELRERQVAADAAASEELARQAEKEAALLPPVPDPREEAKAELGAATTVEGLKAALLKLLF